MQFIALAFVAVIGTLVLVAIVRSGLACKRLAGARRWVGVLGSALGAVGALGFFGLAFSDLGGLRWLPSTFEWPVGSVHGSLTMYDGTRVVPVVLAGKKIQIYSPDWQFVRGWYVPAGGGGQFLLQLAGTNKIEVITRRPAMRYIYDVAGSLISAESYAPKAFGDFPGSTENAQVPTPWWLWMFTSMMHPWFVFILGGALLLLANRSTKEGNQDAQPTAPPNGSAAKPLGGTGVSGGPPSVS